MCLVLEFHFLYLLPLHGALGQWEGAVYVLLLALAEVLYDVPLPVQDPLGGEEPLHPHRAAGVDPTGTNPHLSTYKNTQKLHNATQKTMQISA